MTVFLPLMLAAQAATQPAVVRQATIPPPSQTVTVQQPGVPIETRKPSALPSLQGFNIVLLIGESAPSGASIEDVPPAARKALADMKDFLPFKHYRVLDSQWTSCCAAEGGRQTIAGRVQGVTASVGSGQGGPETRLLPRSYAFMLQVAPSSGRLSVYFSLSPESSGRSGQNMGPNPVREIELEKRLSELHKELDTLEDEIPRRAKEKSTTASHPEIQTLQAQKLRVEQRIAETVNQLAGARAHNADADRGARGLIDSNFTMDLGETVVVGTSRLGGDKALIAIVTAVRKSGR